MFTNISKWMEKKYQELGKFVQGVEKEYLCQNIKIDTLVENVDSQNLINKQFNTIVFCES